MGYEKTELNNIQRFAVEDYNPVSGKLYQYTLRDTLTGEALCPLTSEQGEAMKLALCHQQDSNGGVK